MNWRSFFWWVAFSAIWIALFAEFLTRLPWLIVSAGGLLGFLTLCGKDIFDARRKQREMRREYRKRYCESGKQESRKRFKAVESEALPASDPAHPHFEQRFGETR